MKQKWSLFLDRDGVINSTANGFVNQVEDIEYEEGALEALAMLAEHFSPIVVVTNQAGIGYGYMTSQTLEAIHAQMAEDINAAGGHIDAWYYCPDRVSVSAPCRKPNIGMGHWAKRDFPTIDFQRAWMVGDRDTDIIFGHQLRMKTAWIGDIPIDELGDAIKADYYGNNLLSFAHYIVDQIRQHEQ